jgi:glutamine synthetase
MNFQEMQILDQIDLLLTVLRQRYSFFPVFAAEIEFYLTNTNNDLEVILSTIESITGLKVQSEKGYQQYEIATDIYDNPFKFIKTINSLRTDIATIAKNYGVIANFEPKPYLNDYGSAMHFHMHLNNTHKYNIFNTNEITKNKFLLHTIGGILELLNKSLYMITGDDENEFKRFSSGFMAPINISWGKNNRTTVIRIPETNPLMKSRRIEFRAPSAQVCVSSVILFLTAATFYGLYNNVIPINCIYGNAHDDIYNLTGLCANLDEAKHCFSFHEIICDLIKKCTST